MPATEKERLEAGARTAVLVRRSDLPVPFAHGARSFFGGLPKLPPEFDWPRSEVRAADEIETVALTFVAQIDLTELPDSDARSLLPRTGTLYFFCSSVFEGEGHPPCRIYYYPSSADPLPERAPPPDLMPLAGTDGACQVKWLDPGTDLHSKVEFKYALSFLPFRDFPLPEGDDPLRGELRVAALCEALGPGASERADLLVNRTADEYKKDEDWPFNWLLIAHVVRSVLARVREDLRPSSYRKAMNDETRDTLRTIEAEANQWLERCAPVPPLESTDANAKQAFRAWWAHVALKYEKMSRQVSTYSHKLPEDLGHAIDHTIRYMAAYDERALVHVPDSYVAKLKQQNRWQTPGDGTWGLFFSAIHQIAGYGGSWQDAPIEHQDDFLLLQIQGDGAFFNWHNNCGCVLHFWIDRDALSKLDFSQAVATLECD
jgi:Domain of unknown function (DUF1963)